MNEALVERSIRDLETCHCLLNRNLCALYEALTSEGDAYVMGCGDVGENRLHRAFLFAWLLECWLDGRDVDEEARPLFTQVATLLREKTPAKAALLGHLVRRLRDNAYKAYPDGVEDFATLESRIQHLEICHVDWESNLMKLLHEIGEGRMLYAWNADGGFFACGHACTADAFPRVFIRTVAERHGIEPPSEITQESVQRVFRKLANCPAKIVPQSYARASHPAR